MAYTTLAALAAAVAADAGQTSAGGAQTAFTSVGALAQGQRSGPPRVVWVPGDGELLAPTQEETDYKKVGYTHRLECRITFLGADYDAADSLMRDWLAALQRTQGGNCCTPRGTEYRDETITGTNRHEIAVICDVDLPVYFESYSTADVDLTSQTGTVVNPS